MLNHGGECRNQKKKNGEEDREEEEGEWEKAKEEGRI